jgi:hypothetical protein
MMSHPFCPQFFMHQSYLSLLIKNSNHLAGHLRLFGAVVMNDHKIVSHAVGLNFRQVVCWVK